MKKAFSLVEICFVLFIIAAVFFAVVPFSVSNIKLARFISEWKGYMEQVSYSFETLTEYKKYNNIDEKESVKRLFHYLDAKPVYDEGKYKNYRFKMMNGKFYQKLNIKKYDEVYTDIKGRLIGVEYSKSECTKTRPCTTVWVDLNSKKKPNIVGKDIFIYEIYEDSVSPYGKGIKVETMKKDCSKKGTGMTCSQFYILGGDLKE